MTEELVPRHLPMRQAKQNHLTVSIGSTRSNKSIKKIGRPFLNHFSENNGEHDEVYGLVISVTERHKVGMLGLGKTTLAEQIYNDQIVSYYFDIHGKCQAYSWRGELLLTLLNDVEPSDHTKKADDQLTKELRQVLLTKRFLILIDDVWDTKAWDYLHMCFQGIKNSSRIILTTRLSDVAQYAKCESNPYDLPLLRDDESWKLLQKKVFHEDNCQPELGDVGFKIAKSCGGLPLFIVLVAGVLKEKNNKEDLWKKVEDSLDALSIDRLEESMSIIGFSYMNLPLL
ncbi:hypothetical protein H5410_025652 [Solanum commersonii]|uniref:NB-ARC domain-containing protein n=1 Tax=Solanum commersonii TaxID=4109 RepID=A0A9J5YWH8_SOLCO|nr:hypothetical protein H5410_025652 [Solanum commersonii]